MLRVQLVVWDISATWIHLTEQQFVLFFSLNGSEAVKYVPVWDCKTIQVTLTKAR